MDSEVLALVVRAKDEASGTFKKISGELKGFGGAMGGIAGDLGKLGLIAGGAALTGVGALAGGLAMATKAAAEEQVGVERLGQTLKNNVKGFDGNTDAIEKAIKAREKLAFSDDALRDSLNLLVPRTKDVNEAMRLQALAMDLARAKGMDLETATGIIGKVYGGNTAILTRYGIAVDKNATSTEALAAIQAQVAGQAEAYGKTTTGTFESLQIAVNDVVEDIGGALLPVVTQFAQGLTGTLIPAIQDIAGRFQEWVTANQPLIDQIRKFAAETLTELVTLVMTQIIPGFVTLLERAAAFGAKVATEIGPTVADFATKIGELAKIIVTQVAPVIQDFAMRVWEGGLGKAVKAVVTILGQVVGAIIELAKVILSNKDVINALGIAADVIGTAFGLAADVLTGVVSVIGDIGKAILSNKDVLNALAVIGSAIATAFQAAGGFISGVIDAVKTAIGLAKQAGDLIGGVFGGGKAAGGPVTGGTTYLVGEQGPELFTPASSGAIVPNRSLGGGSVSVNVSLSGAAVFDPYGTAAQQVATALLPGLKRALTASGMSLA